MKTHLGLADFDAPLIVALLGCASDDGAPSGERESDRSFHAAAVDVLERNLDELRAVAEEGRVRLHEMRREKTRLLVAKKRAGIPTSGAFDAAMRPLSDWMRAWMNDALNAGRFH